MVPLVETIDAIRDAVRIARAEGKSIGLVPTMGALHAGHAALIREARRRMGFVVTSIFVNPTQFGPSEDLSRYPRTLDADRELCGAVGTDAIFLPQAETMYPEGYASYVEVERLGNTLCGAYRPGHFRGVTTVVAKLFLTVLPDVAFFGRKDAQQFRILRQMTLDLNFPVQVEELPTVREPDGLAMSSRNRYLDPTQRRHAAELYRTLQAAELAFTTGERSGLAIAEFVSQRLAMIPSATVQYATVVDDRTLQPIERIDRPALLAIAVFFGTTRLIDNVALLP